MLKGRITCKSAKTNIRPAAQSSGLSCFSAKIPVAGTAAAGVSLDLVDSLTATSEAGLTGLSLLATGAIATSDLAAAG